MRVLSILVLIPLISSLATGQEGSKDAKPKDPKEIAVARLLEEPDRFLKELREARDQLSRTRTKEVRTRFNGTLPNGVPPFFLSEAMKAEFIKSDEQRVSDLEKKLEGAKAGRIPVPRIFDPDSEAPFDDCRVGMMGAILLRSRPYNYSLEAAIPAEAESGLNWGKSGRSFRKAGIEQKYIIERNHSRMAVCQPGW